MHVQIRLLYNYQQILSAATSTTRISYCWTQCASQASRFMVRLRRSLVQQNLVCNFPNWFFLNPNRHPFRIFVWTCFYLIIVSLIKYSLHDESCKHRKHMFLGFNIFLNFHEKHFGRRALVCEYPHIGNIQAKHRQHMFLGFLHFHEKHFGRSALVCEYPHSFGASAPPSSLQVQTTKISMMKIRSSLVSAKANGLYQAATVHGTVSN